MTHESAGDKARRYLGDGRLTIRQFSPDPEQLCAHTRALRLVTVAHQEQETDHV